MTATRFKTWALVATALVGWILFFTAMGRLEESQASSWAELQNLREAAGLLAGIKTTINSANQELRQASADRDHAQAEANQARQRIAELRRETNEVAQAINARKQEVVSLQRESETVRQQTIETQAELQRLQELATAKAAESDWSEKLVQAARARKATLDSELSVGAEQTAALDRERTKLEQALAELRSARDKTASELQTFSEQRELLRNENARLTDELTANKRECGDLDDRLQATRLEIAAAAARLQLVSCSGIRSKSPIRNHRTRSRSWDPTTCSAVAAQSASSPCHQRGPTCPQGRKSVVQILRIRCCAKKRFRRGRAAPRSAGAEWNTGGHCLAPTTGALAECAPQSEMVTQRAELHPRPPRNVRPWNYPGLSFLCVHRLRVVSRGCSGLVWRPTLRARVLFARAGAPTGIARLRGPVDPGSSTGALQPATPTDRCEKGNW